MKELNILGQLELDILIILEIQECFKLFTVHGGGSINAVELQKVCKSVGKEFSEEDIREILLEVDEKRKTKIPHHTESCLSVTLLPYLELEISYSL